MDPNDLDVGALQDSLNKQMLHMLEGESHRIPAFSLDEVPNDRATVPIRRMTKPISRILKDSVVQSTEVSEWKNAAERSVPPSGAPSFKDLEVGGDSGKRSPRIAARDCFSEVSEAPGNAGTKATKSPIIQDWDTPLPSSHSLALKLGPQAPEIPAGPSPLTDCNSSLITRSAAADEEIREEMINQMQLQRQERLAQANTSGRASAVGLDPAVKPAMNQMQLQRHERLAHANTSGRDSAIVLDPDPAVKPNNYDDDY